MSSPISLFRKRLNFTHFSNVRALSDNCSVTKPWFTATKYTNQTTHTDSRAERNKHTHITELSEIRNTRKYLLQHQLTLEAEIQPFTLTINFTITKQNAHQPMSAEINFRFPRTARLFWKKKSF